MSARCFLASSESRIAGILTENLADFAKIIECTVRAQIAHIAGIEVLEVEGEGAPQ